VSHKDYNHYSYLFWTDWSADHPCIGRSGLDGSNPIRIVENPVSGGGNIVAPIIKWPNGITVDILTNKVYWVCIGRVLSFGTLLRH